MDRSNRTFANVKSRFSNMSQDEVREYQQINKIDLLVMGNHANETDFALKWYLKSIYKPDIARCKSVCLCLCLIHYAPQLEDSEVLQDGIDSAALPEAHRDRNFNLMKRFAKTAKKYRIKHFTYAESWGDRNQGVLSTARLFNSRMIILAHKKRPMFSREFFVDTFGRVFREAHCPVTLISK